MAVSGFKGFGWLLGIAVVSPACYMVSSQVAAERGRVEAVEMAILDARKDIRALETEFDTRANLAQLERWNGDILSLSAPRPEQYVSSDAQLAALRPVEGGHQYASLVVPAATDLALAEVKPVEQPAVKLALPKVAPIQTADAAPAPLVSRPTLQKALATAATAKPRIQKVAMIDSGLLSDATFGDLVSSARRERGTLR
ncbi:hypothetical protein ASE86_06385 [Sphingomonas sp. Leaf33]|uniref:hypothetical protein n=1 Tax=Sphingomonas sp. Leaf33 TaxID=1736215 RepID=UPI0006FED0B1|nr:hypothetical protein [Sphingomonas sp. Leaf33]KQN25827.1 hypothetical protein ASE86_06385 [Sphingomonas sp. Leaf33]